MTLEEYRKIGRRAFLCSLLRWREFRYPQSVQSCGAEPESDLEKLKWIYRCWFNQLERAERGSGLESYFRNQNLRFVPPLGTELGRATLSAAGDFMAVDRMDYESTPYLFDGIRDFYFDADIVCGNLESTVYEKAPIGRNQPAMVPPRMNTSVGMLERFLDKGRGVSYFSTANNHCFDYGEEGLLATIEQLEKRGCLFSGTNRSPEEQEDVLVVEKNGIRIAFLSYTFATNGNGYEKKHLLNEVRFNDEGPDISLVERHIRRAKERGADIIVASAHWGWEFEMYPHVNIVEMGHCLLEAGIDVILGGHPHVCQPMERYAYVRNGQKREGLIVYSLGDFVSYHPFTRNSKITWVLKFDVVKTENRGLRSVRLSNLRVLPVYILSSDLGDSKFDCRLVKFDTILEHPEKYRISKKDRKNLKRQEQVLKKILLPADSDFLIEA